MVRFGRDRAVNRGVAAARFKYKLRRSVFRVETRFANPELCTLVARDVYEYGNNSLIVRALQAVSRSRVMKEDEKLSVVLRWLGWLGDKRNLEKIRGNSNMGKLTADSD